MSSSTITVNTRQGEAVATRDMTEAAWEIKYPWGTEPSYFYGDTAALIEHMDKEISSHPGEERSYLPRKKQ